MRKRSNDRVCRCTPYLGILLGDLCAATGHPWWAMKVWCLTLVLICEKDYADWIDVWINPDIVNIDYVLSETECLILGRRIDDKWRELGHPEKMGMERVVQGHYDGFWYEKYDYDRSWESQSNAEVKDYEQRQATEALFNACCT